MTSTLDELFVARTAVVVPDVVGSEVARAMRARLVGFERYPLVDRGSYEVADAVVEPELVAVLAGMAGRHTGRSLAWISARALRLGPGDYLLAHHDRVVDDAVELMLDLSSASVPGAELHYRRAGRVFLRVPCVPGALSIVERTAEVICNHTYISKRHTGASVVRLVVELRDA